MVKVKKTPLLNESTESTAISMTLRKTKKVANKKPKKTAVSKGLGKMKKIFTDKKTGKRRIKYGADKGVVYVEHIPHGFYEKEIQDFFNQFGKVTAVNLPRSKNGRSKGFGFIQFEHPEVAKVAADAMNNYLMFNRLIKTKYIPPEQQKSHLFRKAEYALLNNRTPKDLAEIRRKKDIKKKSKYLNSEGEKEFKTKVKNKLIALKKRCAGLGVDFYCQVAGGSKSVKLISAKKLIESPQPSEGIEKSKKVAGGSKSVKLISAKKLIESRQPSEGTEKSKKVSTELVPVKIKTPKKGSKIPKLDKKNISKSLKKMSAELVPAKVKALKKISKIPKFDRKTALKKTSVGDPAEVKTLKASGKTLKQRTTRVKKSVEKCLKKIDKEIPPVLKKKINKSKTPVKKRVPKKFVPKKVTQV